MATGLRLLYGPDYREDEGGAVAVVEFCEKTGKWLMTGIVVTGGYTTAHSPRDGVDQLVDDIWDRHVHRRGLESREGVELVESETYDSQEEADLAARRWLDHHVC